MKPIEISLFVVTKQKKMYATDLTETQWQFIKKT